MTIQRTRNTSLSSSPQLLVRSATERNLRESASSRNASTILTLPNQPPLLGIDCSMLGKTANKANGRARAIEKPNMPIAGPSKSPILEACTSRTCTAKGYQGKSKGHE